MAQRKPNLGLLRNAKLCARVSCSQYTSVLDERDRQHTKRVRGARTALLVTLVFIYTEVVRSTLEHGPLVLVLEDSRSLKWLARASLGSEKTRVNGRCTTGWQEAPERHIRCDKRVYHGQDQEDVQGITPNTIFSQVIVWSSRRASNVIVTPTPRHEATTTDAIQTNPSALIRGLKMIALVTRR